MLVSLVPIGNSRGIRLPKIILERLSVKNKMEMEVTEKGIMLSPIKESPREGWKQAFCDMHQNGEDILEEMPDSGDFEWEW